jgi:hypothetical protein
MLPVSNDVKEMKDEDVERFIKANKWTFAKTMPHNPHWYIVRAQCNSEEDFKGFVMHIRRHGHQVKFGNSWYTHLHFGEYTYWTMGSPLNILNDEGVLVAHTIILNRAYINPPKE